MLRQLYTALFYAGLPFVLGRLAWRSRKLPAYRERWPERLARYPDPPASGVVWFHAVSVGEAEAAFPIIRAFLARFPTLPVLVTCTTPTGSARIREILGDGVRHVYLPYDLPHCVVQFLDHFRPLLGVILETEIWPNYFLECRSRGIPLAIINGRLSGKSARAYRRIRRVVAECLSGTALIAAQTAADAERFSSLGARAERVRVAGNVKFDFDFSETLRREAFETRHALFGTRPVWIAGSTHGGEEEQVLAAHRQVLGEIPDAVLVLAPRHPERVDQVAALCAKAGLAVRLRSEGVPCGPAIPVFLLDTLGELRRFYGASDVAFVGGSLIPRGGHNLLEPAAAGLPVLFGPSVFNFAEIARNLEAAGGGIGVSTAGGLADWTLRLLREPEQRAVIGEKGKRFVEANRGAVERIVAWLAELLPPA